MSGWESKTMNSPHSVSFVITHKPVILSNLKSGKFRIWNQCQEEDSSVRNMCKIILSIFNWYKISLLFHIFSSRQVELLITKLQRRGVWESISPIPPWRLKSRHSTNSTTWLPTLEKWGTLGFNWNYSRHICYLRSQNLASYDSDWKLMYSIEGASHPEILRVSIFSMNFQMTVALIND